MDILAKIVALLGQAWAENATGERRLLTVGDELRADEALKLEVGAQIDLDFGNNQLITFLGEQEVTADQRNALVDENSSFLAMETREASVAEIPTFESTGTLSEGHGFLQLVRIGEVIEANGITP